MTKMKRSFGMKTLVFVALASVILSFAITAGLDITAPSRAQDFWKEGRDGSSPAEVRLPNFVELADKLSSTVVNISTTQVMKERPLPFPEFRGPFDDFFGQEFKDFFNKQPQREFKRQSLGSGFIINKEGYILTNYHVIENASEIIVTLSEGKKDYKAKVIGQDQKIDIALIKIEADGDLPVATFGDSEELRIGEWVLAIGNPFGLGGTVTAGIVSQKGRVIGAGPYDNFIQTDASINPGNSGGPLFNMYGQVVGINTAIVAGGQGIGFATPINMAKDVLLQLKESGKVTRGWVGVTIQDLTPELAKTFGLKEAKGVLISSVNPGDPADKAGMKAGDIIVEFDGTPIEELNDLPRTVAAAAPGKTVKVKVIRDGKEKTLSVTVGTRADEAEAARPEEGEEPAIDKKLGLSVQPIPADVAKKLEIPVTAGVLVASVNPGSPAADAGLRRFDVIKEVNRKKISSVDDFNKEIKASSSADVILMLIQRGKNIIYVVLKMTE